MILIDKEDVQEMINETPELTPYQFSILDEKLAQIKTRAVIRICDGCFGATFGDCDGCERVKVTE